MRARCFVAVFLFVALGASGRAQAPMQVTACDLVNSPQKYAGKVIEVRARVDLAFEDFSLAQNGCEDAYPGVWLVYGGDVPTPTPSTVNDLERKPGSVLRVNGVPVPLEHDASLELFKQRLNARRLAGIGERPCYDCYLFRVTATLKGMFFAGGTGKENLGGYGHLGCCHLLAIEQVRDVEAERTQIPFGGSFRCSSDVRKLTPGEAQRLHAFDQPCGTVSFRRCQELNSQQIAAAAAYWDDPIQPEEGRDEGGMIQGNRLTRSWESPDKLKVYKLEIDSDASSNPDSKATGGTITRETCQAVIPPLPMIATPNCQEFSSEFPVRDADMDRVRREAASGNDGWRMGSAETASREALTVAAATWQVNLAQDLRFEECNKPMEYEGDQLTWCGWSDPAGMQTFSVQVTRFGRMRHGKGWEAVPWLLTRGNGVACTPRP